MHTYIKCAYMHIYLIFICTTYVFEYIYAHIQHTNILLADLDSHARVSFSGNIRIRPWRDPAENDIPTQKYWDAYPSRNIGMYTKSLQPGTCISSCMRGRPAGQLHQVLQPLQSDHTLLCPLFRPPSTMHPPQCTRNERHILYAYLHLRCCVCISAYTSSTRFYT